MENIQDNDFKWFIDNFESLNKKYGDCYLVIKNQKVLIVTNSYASGVKNALKTEERGSFIVQRCSSDKINSTNTFISSLII